MLLAQINRGGPIQPDNAGVIVAGMLGFVCVILLIALVVSILFFLTLMNALKKCRARNRTMEPGMVWLNLIPIFNIYWLYRTIVSMSESLKNEFQDRGDHIRGDDYARQVGMVYIGCFLLNIILSAAGNATQMTAISLLSMLVSLAGLVIFIIYWVKIAGYSKRLNNEPRDRGERRDDDDYEDDNPRRRNRRDNDDDYDDRPPSR